MRSPDYLSPSALSLFEKNPDGYFARYICAIKQERDPQTDPMSVGSAFDALVKNRISVDLWGHDVTEETEFRIRDLVVKQCEPHTLPESLRIACILFEQYLECGAYDQLMEVIQKSAVRPRMEFDVVGTVGGVPLLGKPDLHFHTLAGGHCITDWKVSGSCSKCGVSPQQGYMIALDCHNSRTNGQSHKKFEPLDHNGLIVNKVPMNETTDYWASQLATYAWALGEEVGSQDFVCRIEQLAIRPGFKTKCCVHQALVSAEFQHELLARYQRCWQAVQENHIWQDLSKEESRARGEALTKALLPSETEVNASDVEDWSW